MVSQSMELLSVLNAPTAAKVPSLNHRYAILAIVLMGFVLVGCQTTTTTQDLGETFPEAQELEFSLQSGDTVEISYPYWPELNVSQTIRPDGMIALQFIGDIQAQGERPADLRETLLERYAGILKNPDLTITVSDFDNRRVYVTGEVLQPGAVPLLGQKTVLEAIVEAGGFIKESAKPRKVVLVRQHEETYHTRLVDIKAVKKGKATVPVYLQANDVIVVPRTTIDRIDQAVEQYVNQLIPRQFNYTISRDVGETRVETVTTAE